MNTATKVCSFPTSTLRIALAASVRKIHEVVRPLALTIMLSGSYENLVGGVKKR